ncbi:Uncharacterised protein r2_g3360 [Pycnogonum litorale]
MQAELELYQLPEVREGTAPQPHCNFSCQVPWSCFNSSILVFSSLDISCFNSTILFLNSDNCEQIAVSDALPDSGLVRIPRPVARAFLIQLEWAVACFFKDDEKFRDWSRHANSPVKEPSIDDNTVSMLHQTPTRRDNKPNETEPNQSSQQSPGPIK